MASKKETRESLQEQLESLKKFPNNNLVKKLRKQIKDKLTRLEKQPKKAKKPTKVEIRKKANQSRSSKQKKYWRYIKLIHDNFPNQKITDIRKQFSKRKQGNEVSIPDAVWQNPSP